MQRMFYERMDHMVQNLARHVHQLLLIDTEQLNSSAVKGLAVEGSAAEGEGRRIYESFESTQLNLLKARS